MRDKTNLMVCVGICQKYKSSKSNSHITKYDNGRKRCNTCDIYMKWDGIRCPCCNRVLRIRPKHTGIKYQTAFNQQIKRM